MKTLVFGSCNIDLVYSVDHIASPGETLAAIRADRHPGGKGLNQAIALSRAGADTWFCGAAGEDGAFLLRLMENCGVHTEKVKKSRLGTGKAFIQVARSGENCIVIDHGANFDIGETDIDAALSGFSAGDLIVLQNEISSLPSLIRKAREKGMRIALNPSPFDPELLKLDLSLFSYLILNETEAAAFTGEASPEKALAELCRLAPSCAFVLTLGKEGSLYACGERVIRQRAYPVPAVDTTGAGDTFTGFFLALAARGEDAGRALRVASAAAALAVTKVGAASSVPTLAEAETALKQFETN